MSQIRILIVEDEAIVAMDLRLRLEALGYEITNTVASGEEAIETIEADRPALVLMDIMLRGELDGIETSEIVRARFGLPVIFVTAYADPATLERAKITEPFGYVLKPFDDRELQGHIEIALYKHRSEKRLRESQERYELTSLGANDGLWDWDFRSHEIYFSPRWKAILGYNLEELSPHPREWFSRLHPVDSNRVKREFASHVKGIVPHFESEYRIRTKDDGYRWVLTRGLGVRDANGNIYRMAGSLTDITDRKIYDPTTGLPGKSLFLDRIKRELDRSKRSEDGPRHFALLCVEVCDVGLLSEGEQEGDRDALVNYASNHLEERFDSGGAVAHLGDGRFGVVIDDMQTVDDVKRVSEEIQGALAVPFQVNGQECQLHPTIGIALARTGYASAADMLRDAETAIGRAKTSGRSRIEIFDESMRSRLAVHIQKEENLRWGIEREQIEVHYQPIVSLGTGEISGFEALARWRNGGELLLPKDFVPFAEETGLVSNLDKLVLRTAMEEAGKWKRAGESRSPLIISVNLSARCYGEPDLAEKIEEIIAGTGFDPACLKLELTESALIENMDVVAATLTRLRDLGIQIAMDDFGTGYSSLSYLHRFPIGTLKIDRSFVSDLGIRQDSRKIVQTIVALGRNLGLEVTAEGVENTRQIIELQAFDCTSAQGFLFSRPLTKEAARKLLAGEMPWMGANETVEKVFLAQSIR